MTTLHVVTPVTRPDHLPALGAALAAALDAHFAWTWWVSFDAAVGASEAPRGAVVVPAIWSGGYGAGGRNACLDRIAGGWVWHCDDDNLPHPAFAVELCRAACTHPDAPGFVFAQERSPGHISPPSDSGYDTDTAQFVFRRAAIGAVRWDASRYDHDGLFRDAVEAIAGPAVRVPAVACYHNRARWPAG